MSYTLQEKYDWILTQLRVEDIDLWEKDAMLTMKKVYFQFGDDVGFVDNMDKSVEIAMADWSSLYEVVNGEVKWK